MRRALPFTAASAGRRWHDCYWRSRNVKVPAGIYDAQAVHEQDRRVVSIRWQSGWW